MTFRVNAPADPSNSPPCGTVAVIGMGYVGAVSSAGLCAKGWRVIGVEVNPAKLRILREGGCPVREPGLAESLACAMGQGLFQVTDDLAEAVMGAEVVMVAVGTPGQRGGGVDMQAIDRVTDELVAALARDQRSRVVMIRSTVPPGSTAGRIAPKLRQANPGALICHHPEFLREGSALADWRKPSMIVCGAEPADRPGVEMVLERLYADIDAPRLVLACAESELLKYACNVFHALKIDFANEIGSLAAACGADPGAVMAALCRDQRLNISPAYLKPGFAFGGSCLPKDTQGLVHAAQQHDLKLPLIESIMDSNRAHLARQVERILQLGRRPTVLIGLSFKAGSDDLRHSPMVELAETLLGKGVPLVIYDPDLLPDQLLGANERYIRQHLPHLNLLLRANLQTALTGAEVVILAKRVNALEPSVCQGKIIVDLTSLQPRHGAAGENAVRLAA